MVTRDATPYAQRRQWVAPEGYGVDAENPTAGYYRTRLRSGGVQVGVYIWFGPPFDPETGEELDRGQNPLDDGPDTFIAACAFGVRIEPM